MKSIKFNILAVLSLSFFFCIPQTFAQELPAETLLKAFGENCSMNGELASTTTQQARVLVSLLTEIRDNPDCSTLPWAAANANLLAQNASQYENLAVTTTESEYLLALREERILLTALAAAKTNPDTSKDVIDTIESQLQYVQKSLSRSAQQLTSGRKSQIFQQRSRTYGSLVQTSNSIFGPGVMGDGCWTKRKGWFEGITVAATSMLASTLSSTYALPISAGAELAGQLMDVIRKAKINSSINRVADGVAQKAYQCGVEKIADQWCSARDQKLALNALAADLVSTKDQTPILHGLTILDEDLPVILTWLEKVAIGFRPTNGEVADKQSRFLNRRTLVERASIEGNGLIADRKPVFDRAPTREHKWLEIKRLINDLRNNLVTLAAPLRHPIFELIPESVYPYYLLGRNDGNYPRGKDGKILNWEAFSAVNSEDWGDDSYVADLDLVQRRFSSSIAMADEIIRKEREEVLNADGLLLLSDALEANVHNQSARKSLEEVRDFLKTNAPKSFANPVEEKLYWQTHANIENILYRIDHALDRDGSGDPNTAIRQIYNTAKLDFGSLFFEAEIRKTIRLGLNELPIKIDGESAKEIFLLGSDDFVRTYELLKDGGSLDDARDDANSAQSSTYTNLKEFGDIFDSGLKTVLENYIKKEAVEGANSPSRELRAALCYKLYSLPEWPKKLKFDLCKGTQLVSSVKGGPKTEPWNDSVLKKSLEDRVCLYYDYKRQRKIYQDTCKRKGENCHVIHPPK